MKIVINKNKKMDSPEEFKFEQVLKDLTHLNGEKIIGTASQTHAIEIMEGFIFNDKKESRTLYYPDFIVETENSIKFIEIKGILKPVSGLKYKIFRKLLKDFAESIHKKVDFVMIKYHMNKTSDIELFFDYNVHAKVGRECKRINVAKQKEIGRKLMNAEKKIAGRETPFIFTKPYSLGEKWEQKINL